jgi:hypothetical protein
MNADCKGALAQINKSWKAFVHKDKPMSKSEVKAVLQYAIQKGYEHTGMLSDEEIDNVLGSLKPPPMSKEPTPEEKAEQELADKFQALLKERTELDLKRGCGVSLAKNEYIGDRQAEIEKEIGQLKNKPNGE